MVTGLSGDRTTLSGIVDTETFGENDAPLSRITIWFTGMPQKWYGTDHWKHYDVMSTEQVQIQEKRHSSHTERQIRWARTERVYTERRRVDRKAKGDTH